MLQLTPLEETVAYQEIAHDSYADMLADMLEQKFNIPASEVITKLQPLNNRELKALGRFLLKAKSYKQIERWLESWETTIHEN